MSEKCEHSTTITDSGYKAFRVEKCTWGCGEYLLSIDDGIMTATYTAAELSRLQAIEAERDALREAIRKEISIAKTNAKENSNPVDKHARWFFEAQAERLAAALESAK